jgi:adenylate cyclase
MAVWLWEWKTRGPGSGLGRRFENGHPMGVSVKSQGAAPRIQATFAFVDLAGFTALTEAQGDEDAADVAVRFATLARAALGPGDRLIKTIGDAVLVTSPSPESGVALVERLLGSAASDPSLPSLRAGLHHGDAVQRDGDVFGAAVNLAARVAAEAHIGEVLGTEPIANAARDSGIPVVDLGPIALKNVRKTIPLFSLALVLGASDTPIDPVCHNPVDRRTAAGRLRHAGKEFWFCSLTCAAAFASNPEWHRYESLRPR